MINYISQRDLTEMIGRLLRLNFGRVQEPTKPHIELVKMKNGLVIHKRLLLMETNCLCQFRQLLLLLGGIILHVFGKGIVSRLLMDLMIYGTVRIHYLSTGPMKMFLRLKIGGTTVNIMT